MNDKYRHGGPTRWRSNNAVVATQHLENEGQDVPAMQHRELKLMAKKFIRQHGDEIPIEDLMVAFTDYSLGRLILSDQSRAPHYSKKTGIGTLPFYKNYK